MKTKLCVLLALNLMSSLSYSGQEKGGGDLCENQIKIVRDDIASWIRKGGHKSLKLDAISADQYSQSMLNQISKAKIRCVGNGDGSYPVEVYGTPKVCRFDISFFKQSTITCSREDFMKLNETNQYVLVHHEYAGLAGVENPTKDDSEYKISNQITAFLVNVITKRLAVKAPSEPTQLPWREVHEKEGVALAEILRSAALRTEFKDCEVVLDQSRSSFDSCKGEYYINADFDFFSKNDSLPSFMGMPVGGFMCDKEKKEEVGFLSLSIKSSGSPDILQVLDTNVFHEIGEEDLHLRLETLYELDASKKKFSKVTISKFKITKVNEGTVRRPKLVDTKTLIRSLTCNAEQE